MSDPYESIDLSPRHALPFLYPGQTQKEAFVNEALARVDALIAPAVEGIASTPPASPVEGEAWLVGSDAQGAWAAHEDDLASYTGGDWLFCEPVEGLRLWDKAGESHLLYRHGWHQTAAPALPIGGQTIDTESRTALAELIVALKDAGIFSD